MPKITPTSPSVLFQLGKFQHRAWRIMPEPRGRLRLTDIRPIDTYVAVAESSNESPHAQRIDWEKRILNTDNVEDAIAAIEEAGKRKDVSATKAIVEYWTRVSTNQVIESDEQVNRSTIVSSSSISAIGAPALPILEGILMDPQQKHHGLAAALLIDDLIEGLLAAGIKCTSAVPALITHLELTDNNADFYDDTWYRLIRTLARLQATRVTPRLKKLRNLECVCDVTAENDLARLGISIEDALRNRQVLAKFESPLHQAAYNLISSTRDVKRLVFQHAIMLNALPDRQAWITINEPQLARDLVATVQVKAGSKRGSLDKLIHAAVGARSKDLTDDHYTYYADEIIDAVAQFVKNSPLRSDSDIAALIHQIRFGNDIRLRYIRREKTDLKLGDKCGDCTATGSIHFGDSTTWLINPSYQIIKMAKGKRFIGKINFTLGTIVGKDGIIIDAIEFNPQAQKGKPYYKDALECFEEAMAFLKDLAGKEDRELFGLTTSNSSGAVRMLEAWGSAVAPGNTMLQLLVPDKDIASILKRAGYEGKTSLYYQMLGKVEAFEEKPKDLSDGRLPRLENEVINPAQIADEGVAAAMRQRNFEEASKLILVNPEWAQKTKEIFGFPGDIKLSPTFLVRKLEKIYADEAAGIEDLKRAFTVKGSNFVHIPT